MRKLKKLRERHWPHRIWEAIVAYANDDADQHAAARKHFEDAVAGCMDWIGGDYDDIQNCRDVEEMLAAQGVKQAASTQPEIHAAMQRLAVRYRADIRALLTWLSAPERHSRLAVHAAEFLRIHGTAIRMHIGTRGYDSKEHLLLTDFWPDHLGSVVSPVCKFILDQIEHHDIGGESLKDVIPIGLCDRPGCGRFRIIKKFREGSGHLFCSNLCKAMFYQASKSKERKAEYMRKYRALVKRKNKKK